MPKHLTSPSQSKKIRYANGSTTIQANKARKQAKHQKSHPNDKNTYNPRKHHATPKQ